MNSINLLMNNISEISNIPFSLSFKEKEIYRTADFKEYTKKVYKDFLVGNKEYRLIISEQDERVLPLLVHFVKDAVLDMNLKKDSLILDVLQGENINEVRFLSEYPSLSKGFSIIVIYVEEELEEIMDLVEIGYEGINTIKVIFDGKLIILGHLDNAKEHAESIKESLTCEFFQKCIISYGYVDKYMHIKDIYERCNRRINIAIKLNMSNIVLDEKALLFEELIGDIDINSKKRLANNYCNGFDKIDAEMLKTIDTFFKCGLNLSESAKELYIHRNTLIYRLDKIQKETGFDIRNFNDAVIFKIILFVWKEYKD